MAIRHPLFEREGDRLTARLSRFQVVNGHALAGEPLDAEGLAALDALEQVMNGADLAAESPVRAVMGRSRSSTTA